jgi:hypothetical protein
MSSADTASTAINTDDAADAPDQTPEQIASEIEATRARLARSVDDLADEANPVVLAQRAIDGVRDFFVDPVTGVRTDRVAKAAGAVAALLVFRGIVRRGS